MATMDGRSATAPFEKLEKGIVILTSTNEDGPGKQHLITAGDLQQSVHKDGVTEDVEPYCRTFENAIRSCNERTDRPTLTTQCPKIYSMLKYGIRHESEGAVVYFGSVNSVGSAEDVEVRAVKKRMGDASVTIIDGTGTISDSMVRIDKYRYTSINEEMHRNNTIFRLLQQEACEEKLEILVDKNSEHKQHTNPVNELMEAFVSLWTTLTLTTSHTPSDWNSGMSTATSDPETPEDEVDASEGEPETPRRASPCPLNTPFKTAVSDAQSRVEQNRTNGRTAGASIIARTDDTARATANAPDIGDATSSIGANGTAATPKENTSRNANQEDEQYEQPDHPDDDDTEDMEGTSTDVVATKNKTAMRKIDCEKFIKAEIENLKITCTEPLSRNKKKRLAYIAGKRIDAGWKAASKLLYAGVPGSIVFVQRKQPLRGKAQFFTVKYYRGTFEKTGNKDNNGEEEKTAVVRYQEPPVEEKFTLSDVKKIFSAAGFDLIKRAIPMDDFTIKVYPPVEYYQYFVDSKSVKQIAATSSDEHYVLNTGDTVFPVLRKCLDGIMVGNGISLPPELIEDYERHHRKGDYNFRGLPCGAKAFDKIMHDDHTELPTVVPVYEYSEPATAIRFYMPPGSQFCVAATAAEVLHTIGYRNEAAAFFEVARKVKIDSQLYSGVNRAIQSVMKEQRGGDYMFHKMEGVVNPLALGFRPSEPIVALLVPDETKEGEKIPHHMVGFYEDRLYDTGLDKVLKVTRDNLDRICGGPGRFLKIDKAKKLCVYKWDKKRRKNKGRQKRQKRRKLDAGCARV